MNSHDCEKTLESMFDDFDHEHSPWKKLSLAWKIVLCTMYRSENSED